MDSELLDELLRQRAALVAKAQSGHIEIVRGVVRVDLSEGATPQEAVIPNSCRG
jgi:hypothetical protein